MATYNKIQELKGMPLTTKFKVNSGNRTVEMTLKELLEENGGCTNLPLAFLEIAEQCENGILSLA